MTTDRHDLARFVDAQRDVHDRALGELRRGRKTSHWMWFVFPQIRGLGHSPMARRYAIASLDEARAYLAHPVLGARLHAHLAALAELPTTLDAETVFGAIDAIKLRSSLTLFAAAGGGEAFEAAIARWCGGIRDEATLARL